MRSPSPGGWQRLMIESLTRSAKTSIVPLPGRMRSGTPASAATPPAHAPAAETTRRGTIRSSDPLRSSASVTLRMRRPARSMAVTREYRRNSAPCATASARFASMSSHGSSAASRTAKARCSPGSRPGSRASTSPTGRSSQGTPAALHAAAKPATYASGSPGAWRYQPPVSSMVRGAMRRRTSFSTAHSRAASGSLTTYRAPEWSRPWYRPLVPLPGSPRSTSKPRRPRRARSRRTPAPVAPPPMTRTSVVVVTRAA